MTNLVERMARLLCKQCEPEWEDERDWKYFMDDAKAAIAMVLNEQLKQSDNIPYMEQATRQFARENGVEI